MNETNPPGDYGVVAESGVLRMERLLPGPIERVWSFLTDPQLRGRWLAAGPMELKPGGAVQMTFRHSQLSHEKQAPERYRGAEGASFKSEVLRCEPPHLLSFTWPQGDGIAPAEVSFELFPRGKQVLLVLTHRGAKDREELAGSAGGWHTHLGVLSAVLADREPPGFWSLHAQVEPEYRRRILDEGKAMGPVVTVRRRFHAPAERVFDAFLDPAIARQFLFATQGGTMLRAEVDARVGGRFCFVERRAAGDAEHHGTYVEIDRPRRLVFSFSTDVAVEGDRVSIDIVPVDGGCELQLTQNMRPEWADYAKRTEGGWTMILESLSRVLGD